RDEDGRDGAVVVEQVALRDRPGRIVLRPEELVEVRELHAVILRLHGRLAAHGPRRLVVAEPLERRRAQVPVVRPLEELDLADELRLDPDDAALPDLRLGGERRRFAAQRLELRAQLVDRALAETGADVADPHEVLAAPDAEDERAEAARATALALRPAADHELLPAVSLHLEPVAAALPLLVARSRLLRHDALELLLARRLEQRLAVLERAGHLDGPRRDDELLEPLAALDQRQA